MKLEATVAAVLVILLLSGILSALTHITKALNVMAGIQ